MMEKFEMVAKTLAGLEEVLAEELRNLGADNVEPGRRMVSFEGDKAMLYKANLCCRTALRILKPFFKFSASDPDGLYEQAKQFDWSTMLSPDKTFCIDTVTYSNDFTNSQYATYRLKDAICDWFQDRMGQGVRPGVRLQDADLMINMYINDDNITLSLDSSGESLHKRGYRRDQTEAPINEVLAAGIILMSGWRGDQPFVDPMCGSGTFLIEAALIAANINPGIYRQGFAFEHWADFDPELFDEIYNDDSEETVPKYPIIGADISKVVIEKAKNNIKNAGVAKYIELRAMSIEKWEEAPQPAGVLVTNPPYGERISVADMEGLYAMIGNRLKFVFQGYHAWIIGYRDEYFHEIGLAASKKIPLLNGSLECELREYVIFEGSKKDFLESGGKIKDNGVDEGEDDNYPMPQRKRDRERDRDDRRRSERGAKREFKRDFKREDDRRDRKFGRDDRRDRKFGRDDRREWKFDRDDRRKKEFDRDDRREKEFGRDDRRERKFDRDDRREKEFGRDDRRERRYDRDDRRERKFDRDASAKTVEPESENPLAKRRNPDALKMLQNKQPSLPSANTTMRSRGWRKKDKE